MINYNIDINCEDPKISTSYAEFVSGDIGAYNLSFAFLNDGKRMDLTGLLPTLKAKRADGVTLSQSGEIKDNRAVFKLESGVYAVPGELYLEIALSDSAKNYVTAKVIIANVIKGIGDTDEVAQTMPSVYVTLLNQTQEKLNYANSILSETKNALDGFYTKDETDVKLEKKADLFYVNQELGKKANINDVISYEYVNDRLDKKANISSVYTKTETDTLLSDRVIEGTVYTKEEMDVRLSAKPGYAEVYGRDEVYTKDEVDTRLNAKPGYAEVYSRDETDALLNTKPDYAEVYGRDETDAKLDKKADKNDIYTRHETDAKIGDKANVLKNTERGSEFAIEKDFPGRRVKGKIILGEGDTPHGAILVEVSSCETGEVTRFEPFLDSEDGNFEGEIYGNAPWIVKLQGNKADTSTIELEYVVADLSSVKQDVDVLKSDMSNIDTALDNIIAIQSALIGGESV